MDNIFNVSAPIENGDLVRERIHRRNAFELLPFGAIQQDIDVFVRNDHVIKADDSLFVPWYALSLSLVYRLIYRINSDAFYPVTVVFEDFKDIADIWGLYPSGLVGATATLLLYVSTAAMPSFLFSGKTDE